MKNRVLKIIFVFFIGISILEINAQTPIISQETLGKPLVTIGNFNTIDTVSLEDLLSQNGLTIKEENGAISKIVELCRCWCYHQRQTNGLRVVGDNTNNGFKS